MDRHARAPTREPISEALVDMLVDFWMASSRRSACRLIRRRRCVGAHAGWARVLDGHDAMASLGRGQSAPLFCFRMGPTEDVSCRRITWAVWSRRHIGRCRGSRLSASRRVRHRSEEENWLNRLLCSEEEAGQDRTSKHPDGGSSRDESGR